MHKAKRKTTNEDVSVFVYDIKSGSDIKLEIAKSSMKRLKTLRHPSVLQYLDSFETDKMLYVATEFVQPLGIYLETVDRESQQNDLYLAWGIFQITVSARFAIHCEQKWAIIMARYDGDLVLFALTHMLCAQNSIDAVVGAFRQETKYFI